MWWHWGGGGNSECVFVVFSTQEIFLVGISVGGRIDPQGGRKGYVNKNSIDTIRNRTRDLAVCSAVPKPTTPRCNRRLAVCATRIDVRGCVWSRVGPPGNQKCPRVTWQQLKTMKIQLLCKPWRHGEVEVQIHTFLTLALNEGDKLQIPAALSASKEASFPFEYGTGCPGVV